ncbi:MAG: peptide chain release factor H [Bacteroidota bacterium]
MKEIDIIISSGRGPAECAWVVEQVYEKFVKDADQKKIKTSIIHQVKGPKANTSSSIRIRLIGQDLSVYLKAWLGTILWIGQSPFRPDHKRKNWFINIQIANRIEKNGAINERDLAYEVFKSGGAGGQNVNKVETAVRVRHEKSGVSVTCSDERSQYMNMKKAKEKLLEIIQMGEMQKAKKNETLNWQIHNKLKRGNPIKSFVGSSLKEKN